MTAGSALIEDVSKRYVKLETRRTLFTSLLPGRHARRSDVWALRDVSMEVGPGESVGVIGPNGAGKTTLLRIMSGVSRPTTGRARVWGRIAPMLAVGVGFNREMTGRQNVFMNAAMLGVPQDEVQRRFDEIVEFSGVEYAIDVPVKHYSSGMYVRLGFSVAMHVDPDILLVDEALAVGDAGFQRRCLDRLTTMHASGVTLLLVSHSMHSIASLCERAVLIDEGRKTFDGPAVDGVARYRQMLDPAGASVAVDLEPNEQHRYVGGVSTVEAKITSPDGDVRSLPAHATLEVDVLLRFHRTVASPCLLFGVTNETADLVAIFHTRIGEIYRTYFAGETAWVRFRCNAHLVGGDYTTLVSVSSANGQEIYEQVETRAGFTVRPSANILGQVDLGGTVEVDGILLEAQAQPPTSSSPTNEKTDPRTGSVGDQGIDAAGGALD